MSGNNSEWRRPVTRGQWRQLLTDWIQQMKNTSALYTDSVEHAHGVIRTVYSDLIVTHTWVGLKFRGSVRNGDLQVLYVNEEEKQAIREMKPDERV